MGSKEVNFARAIIGERRYNEVETDEVLSSANALLRDWMSGDIRMERPKLYDHYALLLLALIEKNAELEARIKGLESLSRRE